MSEREAERGEGGKGGCDRDTGKEQRESSSSHNFKSRFSSLSWIFFTALLATGLSPSVSCHGLRVLHSNYISCIFTLYWRMLWPRLHAFSSEKCVSRLEFPSTLLRQLYICADIQRVTVSERAAWGSPTQKRRHGRGPRGWDGLQLITTTAPADWWVDVCLIILFICIFADRIWNGHCSSRFRSFCVRAEVRVRLIFRCLVAMLYMDILLMTIWIVLFM